MRFVLPVLIAAVSASAPSSVCAGAEYPELPLRLSDESEGRKAERMARRFVGLLTKQIGT